MPEFVGYTDSHAVLELDELTDSSSLGCSASLSQVSAVAAWPVVSDSWGHCVVSAAGDSRGEQVNPNAKSPLMPLLRLPVLFTQNMHAQTERQRRNRTTAELAEYASTCQATYWTPSHDRSRADIDTTISTFIDRSADIWLVQQDFGLDYAMSGLDPARIRRVIRRLARQGF